MEQCDSIPFSCFIAGLLIIKKSYTSMEVVKVMSKLENMGIIVDDVDDDLESIFCCIEMGTDCSFYLKKGLSYDSVLSNGMKVVDFLKSFINDVWWIVLNDIIDNSNKNIYLKNKDFGEKKKGKVKLLHPNILFPKKRNEIGHGVL